jgi:hypothetical protein
VRRSVNFRPEDVAAMKAIQKAKGLKTDTEAVQLALRGLAARL